MRHCVLVGCLPVVIGTGQELLKTASANRLVIAEWIGWRGVLGCAAALAAVAAVAAASMLPKARAGLAAPFRVSDAVARYRLVLSNPRSFVCFGVVLLEGMAIYGITPFIGDLLRARDAGGLREAGFVIGGLGIGGLLYAAVLPVILRFAKRTVMMATGGAIAGVGLAGGGLDITWTTCAVRNDPPRVGLTLPSRSVTGTLA